MDISIYFSGHNISEYAEVAISSFIKLYPELKDKIYYFDDCSTDDTVEMLNDLGVNRIGWDTRFKNLFDAYMGSGVLNKDGYSQMIRCEFIMKQILSSCNTKYLLNLDGDTVTLKRGFIENYIKSNNAVIGIEGTRYKRADTSERRQIKSCYKPLLLSETTITHPVLKFECLGFRRFHPYHLFIDMSMFGDISCLLSNLNDVDYINDFHSYLDVGSDILLRCIESELPYKIFTEDAYIHHWTWISSSIRDCNHSCKITDDEIVNRVLNQIKSNNELQRALRDIEISPRKLVKVIKNKIRTGDYN